MGKSNKLQEPKTYTNKIFETKGILAHEDQLDDQMRYYGQLTTIYVMGDSYNYYFLKEKELNIKYECKIIKANKPKLNELDLDLFSVDGWQLVVIVPMVRERIFYYHFIRVVF